MKPSSNKCLNAPLPLSLPKGRKKLSLKQSVLVNGIAYIAQLQDKLLARLINFNIFLKVYVLRGGGLGHHI